MFGSNYVKEKGGKIRILVLLFDFLLFSDAVWWGVGSSESRSDGYDSFHDDECSRSWALELCISFTQEISNSDSWTITCQRDLSVTEQSFPVHRGC